MREHFPINYLGLPLSLRRPTEADLQPLMDRFARMLAGWKPQLLTPSRRLILLISVLMALPIYFMTVIPLPVWAIRLFQRKCRGFIWKGHEDTSSGHCLVAWDKVCLPIVNGRLGVKDLRVMGAALRLRWPWYRWQYRERLWTDIRPQKDGEIDNIFPLCNQSSARGRQARGILVLQLAPGRPICHLRAEVIFLCEENRHISGRGSAVESMGP